MNSTNGIIILNSYIDKYFNIGILFFLIIVAVVLFLVGIVMLTNKDYINGAIAIFISLIIGILCSFALNYNEDVIHQDVLVDDSVTFNYIYEIYDVQGKDGDIYHMILKDASKYTNDVNNE